MVLNGVYYDDVNDEFVASINLNGFKLVLGSYENIIDATDVYRKALVDRKNGAYAEYDAAYKEYLDKVNAIGRVKVDKFEIFASSTSRCFYEWIGENLILDAKIYRTDFYNEYVRCNPNDRLVTLRKFWIWIDGYADLMGYTLYSGRDSKARFTVVYISPMK